MSLLMCSLTTNVGNGHTSLIYMSYSTDVWLYRDRKNINWFAKHNWHTLKSHWMAKYMYSENNYYWFDLADIEWGVTSIIIANYNIFVISIIVNKVISV